MASINHPSSFIYNSTPRSLTTFTRDAPTTIINNSKDYRPVCRDFLNGRCSRTTCKYQHNITLLKSQKPNNTYKAKLPPLFQHMFIPGKGCCFVSIQNFMQQSAYNGLFIINLADIIPPSIISKLLVANDISRLSEQICGLAVEWYDKLQKIINWCLTTTPNFNKNNYEIVFVFDISSSVSDWIVKIGYTPNKIFNTPSLTVHHQDLLSDKLLQILSNTLSELFTEIFTCSSTDSNANKYPFTKMNFIITYMNDELTIINKGCLEMLLGMITLSPNKYISTYFYYNIYYIGLPPNLDIPLMANENQGFIFCSINRSKFINLAMIYSNDDKITYLGDPDINANIQDYISHLAGHNSKLYQNLFEKNDKLAKALANAIPMENIRHKSLIVIGCNLDTEFDKQILAGLKEVVGSIDFTGLGAKSGNNKITTGQNINKTNQQQNQDAKKTGDDCCGSSDNPNGLTMSIILPVVNSADTKNNIGSNFTSRQLNDIMTGLLNGNMFSDGPKTGTSLLPSATVGKIIQNRICTLGLKLTNSADGQLSFTQPWITIPGIEKIKEYGSAPDNKIIILCSSKLTHQFFQDFIGQITTTPGFTKKISANFIDFNINPSLRRCLSYNNYRCLAQANYGDLGGQMAIGTDNTLIKNTKLWRRFNQYISAINPITDATTQFKNSSPSSNCCQCCSCISRNGVGYVKFGHIPYIPKTILDEIKDDSWLPRF